MRLIAVLATVVLVGCRASQPSAPVAPTDAELHAAFVQCRLMQESAGDRNPDLDACIRASAQAPTTR